ncbi:MAG: hypothetical protein CMO81_02560 [Waddliaceae bacterium]|nr:hypothetical protein [Waddliaceae bacterium]
MKKIFLSLILIFSISTHSLQADSLNSWQKREEGAAFSGQLLYVGSLVTSIGSSIVLIGNLLELEDLKTSRKALRHLRFQMQVFSLEVGDILPKTYHKEVNEISFQILDRLERMDAYITQERIDQAKEEYRELFEYWSELGDFYSSRLADSLHDRQQVQTWLMRILNLLLDWWYQGSPQGAIQFYHRDTRVH